MIVFVSVKKYQVIFLATGILGLFLCGMFHQQQMTTASAALPISGRVIVLDAGHGGFDGGASANGLMEKEVNLSVAHKLREYIEQGGGMVVMTRREDVSTAEADTQGISAKKSDLTARKQLVEETDADVFVSIHMNKFPQTQYRGAQVFYGGSPEDGKKLGEELQKTLKEVMNDGNERMAKKSDGSIFILKDTSVPSVIVECGFLSNPQEAELLADENYRQKLAWGIYLGLVRYFNGSM